MKISYLTPTRNRPEFMEWLAYVYNAQTWPDKELVVVDDSDDYNESHDILAGLVSENELKWIGVHPDNKDRPWCIGRMRNDLLRNATGDWITWLDDDDWRAPQLAEHMMSHAQLTGPNGKPTSFIKSMGTWTALDLATMKSGEQRHRPDVWCMGLFRRAFIQEHNIRFPETGRIGEDSIWYGQCHKMAYFYGHAEEVDCQDLYLILNHGRNTSDGGAFREFDGPPPLFLGWRGIKEIESLRERLGLSD